MTKKILIIEDEEILKKLLEKKCKEEGFDVYVAGDGQEGMDKVREIHPDLVLLDIVMPKKNGMEVLEEIHNDENLNNIPVVIISNSGQPVEIDKAQQLGAIDWLVKTNFDPEEVIQKVHKVFGI